MSLEAVPVDTQSVLDASSVPVVTRLFVVEASVTGAMVAIELNRADEPMLMEENSEDGSVSDVWRPTDSDSVIRLDGRRALELVAGDTVLSSVWETLISVLLLELLA